MECHHHPANKEKAADPSPALCINNVPILDMLSADEKREVMDASISKQYAKGEVLFSPGHPSSNLWIVHRGSVKISRFSPSGKEQIVRILQPGDFTGELSLFSHTVLTDTAEALEGTEICLIQGKVINDLMLRTPQIAIKFLEKYTERIESAEAKLEQLTLYDVEQRLARTLLDMLHNQQRGQTKDNVIMLPVSKKDLAVMIGTTQESLSRKLALFQEQGWIKLVGHRQIIITDEAGLAQLE
jgi:CRP/FNR family transcriptional regulator, anaerobic regulatory protein